MRDKEAKNKYPLLSFFIFLLQQAICFFSYRYLIVTCANFSASSYFCATSETHTHTTLPASEQEAISAEIFTFIAFFQREEEETWDGIKGNRTQPPSRPCCCLNIPELVLKLAEQDQKEMTRDVKHKQSNKNWDTQIELQVFAAGMFFFCFLVCQYDGWRSTARLPQHALLLSWLLNSANVVTSLCTNTDLENQLRSSLLFCRVFFTFL